MQVEDPLSRQAINNEIILKEVKAILLLDKVTKDYKSLL